MDSLTNEERTRLDMGARGTPPLVGAEADAFQAKFFSHYTKADSERYLQENCPKETAAFNAATAKNNYTGRIKFLVLQN